MLRAGCPTPKPRHDRQILTRAVELTASAGPNYRPARLSFSARRFAEWLVREGIPWPRLDSGELALDDDTFRQMARAYPAVAPLRELRHSLGEMRLFSDLAVGIGRPQPLSAVALPVDHRPQSAEQRAVHLRAVMLVAIPDPARAGAGRGLRRLVATRIWHCRGAVRRHGHDGRLHAPGDPYLTFAKQARAVPADATKKSHPREREQFKVCALAVQYGMGPHSLAQSLGQPEAMARELLRLHRETYPTFWRWSDSAVNHAMLRGWLHTVFGWRVQVGPRANPRSLANFPMQANGAEMLRLACCLATERGVAVCAPVHDALLVEGPAGRIQSVVLDTQRAMTEASRVVLAGFELRSDAKIVCHPDRYSDPRGKQMWETVMGLMAELPQAELVDSVEPF